MQFSDKDKFRVLIVVSMLIALIGITVLVLITAGANSDKMADTIKSISSDIAGIFRVALGIVGILGFFKLIKFIGKKMFPF